MEEKVQFGRRKLDILQTSLGIPVVLTLLGIVTAGLASYYGGQLAVEKNFSAIKERVATVEAKTVEVEDLKAKAEANTNDITAIRLGVAILLNDGGHDAEKVLSIKKP